jgi:integrase
MDIIKSINIFCDTDGKALHPEYASHWWGKFIQRAAFDKVKESYWSDTNKKDMPLTVCKKTGIPQYGIHSLRHTCGSILLSKGYSPAAVAKRLGHRVETLMKIYNHALRMMKQCWPMQWMIFYQAKKQSKQHR